MSKTWLTIVLLITCISNAAAQQSSLDKMIDGNLTSWVGTYKMLHQAPELSHYEEKTASFFAGQLRALGYTVTERMGQYEIPQWTSFGVVAVMKNGPGPTLMLRTELDALPVDEKTNLPYASQAKMKNDAGQEVSV